MTMTRFTKTRIDRRLSSRSPLGQGVIALSALVGLILIPIIGIFSFEIARYQAGVQQLEANTDSAALAGAAMLVTSRFQKPTDRLRRFEEAEKAAENAFKSTFASTGGQLNIILGSTLTSAVNVGRGGRLQIGSQAGYCQFKVEAINPANFQVVEPDSADAKAVRFTALFTGKPAFGRFLQLNNLVPLYSKSTAGVPILDVVMCFDISGSMDDSTRVSMVNRKWTVPEPERSQIEAAWLQYKSARDDFDRFLRSPGYTREECDSRRASLVSQFNDYLNLRKTLALSKGRLDWAQLEYGTLADCVFTPLEPNGSTINCLFPQNLNVVNYTKLRMNAANPRLPAFNCNERYFQETGDRNAVSGSGGLDCATGGGVAIPPSAPSNYVCACPNEPEGMTDIVVHCDQQVNTKPQPIFGTIGPMPMGPGSRFSYTKKRNPYKGQTYSFDGLGYLVEAARGNLEPQRFQQLQDNLFKKAIEIGQLPSQGQTGYQQAYLELASKFCQPAAATVDALENFYQALQGAGSDVRFGLVSYETLSSPPGLTEKPIPDIASKDEDVPNCAYDINSTYPGPSGPLKRPILYMDLATLKDPDKDLIPDPTDASKPDLTINEAFETYLIALRATNTAASLKQALDMLDKSPRKVFARQVIILITDGVATRDVNGNPSTSLGYSQSREFARKANERQIPIFTVGVAQNAAVESLQKPFLGDEQTPAAEGLATLSGNGARFFPVNRNSIIAPGGGQVNAISQAFLQVARSLVQLIE
ncbi:MAG: VWA domain-containing protein [Candidatus Obscuribacterales bacterium]|nr:VWA domain-containing protein [Candidatus Obscuribacterales bacterium]